MKTGVKREAATARRCVRYKIRLFCVSVRKGAAIKRGFSWKLLYDGRPFFLSPGTEMSLFLFLGPVLMITSACQCLQPESSIPFARRWVTRRRQPLILSSVSLWPAFPRICRSVYDRPSCLTRSRFRTRTCGRKESGNWAQKPFSFPFSSTITPFMTRSLHACRSGRPEECLL